MHETYNADSVSWKNEEEKETSEANFSGSKESGPKSSEAEEGIPPVQTRVFMLNRGEIYTSFSFRKQEFVNCCSLLERKTCI